MLVLKPGIPGSNITGTASTPGFYIRFRDGIVEVKDEETIRLIKISEGFKNGDFVAVDDEGQDPFADNRSQTEPTHVLNDMKYGHIEKARISDAPVKIPASLKKIIAAEASKMAKEMVKEMIPGLLKEIAAQASSDEKASAKSDAKTEVAKAASSSKTDAKA